jgi:hypothetical protein
MRPIRTVELRSWRRCRRCGRLTRHARERSIRPAVAFREPFRELLCILHDWLNPPECIEHGDGTEAADPLFLWPGDLV